MTGIAAPLSPGDMRADTLAQRVGELWPAWLPAFDSPWVGIGKPKLLHTMFSELVTALATVLRERDGESWCDTDEDEKGSPVEVMVLRGGIVSSVPVVVMSKSICIGQTKVPLGAPKAGTLLTRALAYETAKIA